MPGAGSADDADVAARNGVGEGDRHAGDDGRAAVGAHDEEPEIAGLALEGDLLLQRHVVGEDHDVEAAPQRLPGLGGGKIAGHRDERQVGVRHLLHRPAQRARLPGGATGGGATRLIQQAPRLGHGGVGRSRILGPQAMTRSPGPACSPTSPSRPASRRISLLAGVPIIRPASSTPGSAAIAREMRIRATESR